MTLFARRSLLIASGRRAGGLCSPRACGRRVARRPFRRLRAGRQRFRDRSGQLALAKSANENIRGYATRAIADYTEAASFLSKSRSEAGVSYAPDPNGAPQRQ